MKSNLESEIESLERNLDATKERRLGLFRERDDLHADIVKNPVKWDAVRVGIAYGKGEKIAASLRECEIEQRKLERLIRNRRDKLADQQKKAAPGVRLLPCWYRLPAYSSSFCEQAEGSNFCDRWDGGFDAERCVPKQKTQRRSAAPLGELCDGRTFRLSAEEAEEP